MERIENTYILGNLRGEGMIEVDLQEVTCELVATDYT
jgi:hypothetical protein